MNPVGGMHDEVRSEFFRANHRHEEVDEEGKGDQPDDEIFHGRGLLVEFGAEDGVKAASQKERGHDDEIDEIIHTLSFVPRRGAAS